MLAPRSLLLSLLLPALWPAVASAEVATIDSAGRMLPPGPYECKMGSYAFRPCEIEKKGPGVELVIPAGIGHFMALRAELLPSDDAGQLTLLGALTSPQNLCDSCAPTDTDTDRCVGGPAVAKACLAQPLLARLKVSGGGARGTLLYYINRPSYSAGKYAGFFKLGNTIELSLRPKKK